MKKYALKLSDVKSRLKELNEKRERFIREDYINRIYDVTVYFKEEIEGIDYESKLKEIVSSN